jgi:hypothetical protein
MEPAPAQDHLWFLESLDRVNRAVQTARDLEGLMGGVLQAVLATAASSARLRCCRSPSTR